MFRLTPLLISLYCMPLLADDIYREVDEDGVPTFSDQALPGGEKIEVKEPITFSDPAIKARMREVKLSPEDDTGPLKYTLTITEPANDSAIRDNAGNLTLEINISPLPIAKHRAELIMNGTVIRKLTSSGPVTLSNLDRGTHQFWVQIVDDSGKVIHSSGVTSITMLRFSRLNRAN